MYEREVSKSQQTFFQSGSANNFTFAFYKVYKRKPKNRFRVRVIQLADYDSLADASPSVYVAQGLVGANASFSGVVTDGSGAPAPQTTGMRTNDFVLGITSRNDNTATTETSGVAYSKAIEFYTDEVSTTPFVVKLYQLANSSYSTDIASLVVVFEITELEEF
jgi:hypothetical protein